jgi:hypothetical protein
MVRQEVWPTFCYQCCAVDSETQKFTNAQRVVGDRGGVACVVEALRLLAMGCTVLGLLKHSTELKAFQDEAVGLGVALLFGGTAQVSECLIRNFR